MTLAIVISVVAVFLCGASIGILAVLVAGIRSEDRAQNLTRTPRTRTEAVTRRLLGAGTRTTEPAPARPSPIPPKANCHDPPDPVRHHPRHRDRPRHHRPPQPPALLLLALSPGPASPPGHHPQPVPPAITPACGCATPPPGSAPGRGRRPVSFTAQYRMAETARHLPVIAALEAAIPDAAALVFASLGIALALHGRRALRARALNLAAVGTSVAMNVLAAGPRVAGPGDLGHAPRLPTR